VFCSCAVFLARVFKHAERGHMKEAANQKEKENSEAESFKHTKINILRT
jgi:hypothetical protein